MALCFATYLLTSYYHLLTTYLLTYLLTYSLTYLLTYQGLMGELLDASEQYLTEKLKRRVKLTD